MNDEVSILPVAWTEDRDRLLAVRTEVFVVEQRVPEEIEVDELDPVAHHLLAVAGRDPIGTARWTSEKNEARIGRVAVLKNWRRHRVGSRLIKAAIAAATRAGNKRIYLHAQCSSLPFYSGLGFRPVGEETFLEAGILHREMELLI